MPAYHTTSAINYIKSYISVGLNLVYYMPVTSPPSSKKKKQQHANARCPSVDQQQPPPFCLLANEVAHESMNIIELNEPDAKQQLIKTNDLLLGTANWIINNDGIVVEV